jgi:uncharacterized coiled-coil protein SlyX
MNKDNIQIDLRKEFEKEICPKCVISELNTVCKITNKCNTRIEWLENRVSLQADRIKKLDEDWKELDSDCMILHDKNKQLKKENKELKEHKGVLIENVNAEDIIKQLHEAKNRGY